MTHRPNYKRQNYFPLRYKLGYKYGFVIIYQLGFTFILTVFILNV